MTVWLGAWMTHIAETGEKQPKDSSLWERGGSGRNSLKFHRPHSWLYICNGLTTNCLCFTFLQIFVQIPTE